MATGGWFVMVKRDGGYVWTMYGLRDVVIAELCGPVKSKKLCRESIDQVRELAAGAPVLDHTGEYGAH